MSIAIQLQSIQAALNDFVTGQGGVVQIASDVVHMWEMAYAASSKLRVIVVCLGEDIRGPFSEAAALHRVDRQFGVLVTRGRSFTTDRGLGLVSNVQTAPPLFDMVATVRDLIRAMLNISVEFPVDYKGFNSFPLSEKMIMDAYLINFSCAVDLGAIVSTPDNPVLPP